MVEGSAGGKGSRVMWITSSEIQIQIRKCKKKISHKNVKNEHQKHSKKSRLCSTMQGSTGGEGNMGKGSTGGGTCSPGRSSNRILGGEMRDKKREIREKEMREEKEEGECGA